MRRVRAYRVAIGVRVAVLAFTGTLVLASCGHDAKVTNRVEGTAEKINMPDQFDTIANRCDGHGFRIYEASTAGSSPAVVRDPNCPGGAVGK